MQYGIKERHHNTPLAYKTVDLAVKTSRPLLLTTKVTRFMKKQASIIS